MISEDLQTLYSSAPAGQFAEDGVSLFHPAFSQSWHFTNFPEKADPDFPFHAFDGLVNGELRQFISHPVRASLPDQNTTGGQRLEVTIANSGVLMASELAAAAAQPTIPITVQVDTYIVGDIEPQDEPYDFAVKTISVSQTAMTLRASGSELLNQPAQLLRFTRDSNPGLSR